MPFSLTVADVTRIAKEAVRSEHAALDVVGVTIGGGEYAEVLLRVQECQEHPCQVSVGVFRDVGESALRADIVDRVRKHVEEHRSEKDGHVAAHA